MSKRLALFGGSFNPPGVHHREIARQLAQVFDEVLIVPCGPRPDKPVTNDVEPVYRAAMVDMTFRGLEKVKVELFDLEAATFTRTHLLEDRFASEGEVWHVVGADLLQAGQTGGSFIQKHWAQGERLWRESRFAVISRPGYHFAPDDLPPRHCLIPGGQAGASSEIRSRFFHREKVTDQVVPAVAAYIERHGLYRGGAPLRQARLQLDQPRLMIVSDERNAAALSTAAELGASVTSDPDLIVVVGGDGTMLRAIRQHWRLRVPFYGINAGHLGFLLNEQSPLELADEPLVLQQLPLLYAEAERADGQTTSALAFNDVWVERATGQTAWIQVSVNDEERLAQLVADGALVSTAAGSTSYARAMGAIPLPLNTPVLLLVGSNVLRPAFWKPVVLPLSARVELRTLDRGKRPLQGYIDGVSQGLVTSLRARVSNIAAVELAFAPDHHPESKLAQIQFPPPS